MLPYTKFSLERNEFALCYVICLSLYDTSLNLLSCSYQELMKESSRMPLFDLRKLNASLPVPSAPKSSIKVLVLGAKDDFIMVTIVTSIVDYLILFSNPVANSVMCYSKFPLPFFSKIIVILSGYTVLSKLLTLSFKLSWLYHDYCVLQDVQGLSETGSFYGVSPVCVEGVAHDMMLDCSWEKGASVILSWLDGLRR